MEKEILPYGVSLEKVIKRLKTDIKTGLTEDAVKRKRREFGINLIPSKKPLAKTRLLLEQFKSPLIYILLIAGFVVLIFKEFTDAIVIYAAIILNVSVGYFQETKASDALRKLKEVIKVKAEVVRDRNKKIIDSAELVPGDIFILNPGDKVPADGRIISSYGLKVDEMVLTGEWLTADKKEGVLPEKTPLGNRNNMVYMGTIVEEGKGMAVVTSTGHETEIGKIARIVRETKEKKTPLQKKISHLSKIIGGIIIAICILIFIEGVISGHNFFEIFVVAVAIAVAAIPEGLPVAITVILALGMQRILKKKGLVRKLASAETLGNTSIIATDKTGTLTEGKMRVTELITETKSERNLALEISAVCSEAFIENPDDVMEKWIIRGRPTDRALLLAGIEAGINRHSLKEKMTEISDIPFNSLNKYTARLFKMNKKKYFYISGAPEKILEASKYFRKNSGKKLLNSKERKKIEKKLKDLTGRGLRVVAVAKKNVRSSKNLVSNLVFVGLIGLKDPVRQEVKKTIKICRRAGMRLIIVTGDHRLTAKAVAKEIGLKVKEKGILEGKDLDQLSDEQLSKRVESIQIYARVEPKHKMRIIQAWQSKGEVVAMTGDGINDTPALKKADIGVSFGSGTEAAKEVSDLVLLTNNFNVIVAAVEEGRAIIDNIRKVITYLLSDSFTEAILIGASLLFGLPLPVTAAQILWVNLIEDGFPDIALAFEKKEKNLMDRKSQGRNTPLLTKEMKVLIFIVGLITDFLLLGLFLWLHKYSNYNTAHIRTIIFAGLTIDSLFYVFSCKSLERNIWHINPFSNKILLFSWFLGAAMLLTAIYFPLFQVLLKTYSLTLPDWEMILGIGLINLVLIEATKLHFIINKNQRLKGQK